MPSFIVIKVEKVKEVQEVEKVQEVEEVEEVTMGNAEKVTVVKIERAENDKGPEPDNGPLTEKVKNAKRSKLGKKPLKWVPLPRTCKKPIKY